MTFTLGVLLEGIGHSDRAIAEVLPIHSFNCCVRSIKRSKINKGITFGVACVRVPHDLGRLQNDPKGAESVIKQLLINLWVQVPNENVGPHIQVFVVS